MKSIDDIILDNKGLNDALIAIPKKKLNTLRCLTNIYVNACLEANVKMMEHQKEVVEKYTRALSKEYDISCGYFKNMLLFVETYYSKEENRKSYKNGSNSQKLV